jgi:ElaA protein
MEISWSFKPFVELTVFELYEIMQLRQRIFIVEQNCAYLDADGKDLKGTHLLGWKGEKLVAYLRILPAGVSYPEHSIGRVVVSPDERGSGLGKQIMLEAIARLRKSRGLVPIRISAQAHLADRYYGPLGFTAEGEIYDEDGIPHIAMLLKV